MPPLPSTALAPVNEAWAQRARDHQATLTKPRGSLGELEALGVRLAAIQGRVDVRVTAPRLCLFAADHGVTLAHPVSPFPRAVTGQMVANILRGGAAINALAAAAQLELELIDLGVDAAIADPPERSTVRLIRGRVRAGSRDFTREPAMTEAELAAALAVGEAAAERAAAAGSTLVGLGEMGIGNTTAAAAMTAALTGLPAARVVGPGTGLDERGLVRKREVVEQGLALHRDRAPWAILRCLGGLEIAALVGLCQGAARRGLAIVVDGFITSAAAAVALALDPNVRGYLFAAHRSAEPGHLALLDYLGQRPLLDLDMRLGEGSGAALAIPLLRAAARVQRDMASFADAGVSEREGPQA